MECPMTDNITHLPRPRAVRPAPEPLGLYIFAGRNDHKGLLNLLSQGDLRCFGIVIDAVHVNRHRELREQVVDHRLDAILDPKTQAAATIGGYTEALGELPWGLDRPHRVGDFMGYGGRERMARLGDFAVEHGFTQVLAPTHLLQDASDPWLARDIEATEWLRAHLDRNGGAGIPLIYSLTIPYSIFRNGGQRRSLLEALRGVPAAAVWLKIDGFGSSSTPTAVCTYINAAADLHELGMPVIGDHVGGLIGLGLVAFGAVGGIAHGVTMHERFDASGWKKQRQPGTGWSMPKRVYVNELDLMLKPDEARLLLESTTRARSLFGCRDRHCCPRGVQDMLENPTRHFLYRRMEDVTELGRTPESLRAQVFLERHLRPMTDRVLAAASINWSNEAMANKTRDKRRRLDALRVALSHQREAVPPRSFATVPVRRVARDRRG
jgi:hypothetical protein